MASKKRKRGLGGLTSSDIVVRWKGTIIMAGPKRSESKIRESIEQRLAESLNRCPYLSMSGLADRYAFEIAWNAPYFVTKQREAARIEHLDVYYCNPPMHWKWWARFRQDRDTLVITGDYYHEGEGQQL